MGSVDGEYRFLFRMETRHQEMQWVKRGKKKERKGDGGRRLDLLLWCVKERDLGLLNWWMDLKERKRKREQRAKVGTREPTVTTDDAAALNKGQAEKDSPETPFALPPAVQYMRTLHSCPSKKVTLLYSHEVITCNLLRLLVANSILYPDCAAIGKKRSKREVHKQAKRNTRSMKQSCF